MTKTPSVEIFSLVSGLRTIRPIRPTFNYLAHCVVIVLWLVQNARSNKNRIGPI